MRTLLILSDGPSFFPHLAGAVGRAAPGMGVRHVPDRAALDAIPPAEIATSRLVGFATGVVVPARILAAAGFGAYNFHSGPPDYPGWRPVSFAILDGAKRFGATAHVMAPRVDTGPIVGTAAFAVTEGSGEADLNQAVVLALFRLFAALLPALVAPAPLPVLPTGWTGRARRRAEAAALRRVTPDMDEAALALRIRAFGSGPADSRPVLRWRGRDFVLAAPPPRAEPDLPDHLAIDVRVGG